MNKKNFLGKGRSASVYKVTLSGKEAVRKIFTGSGAADVAMSLFFGTTVDYQWCESAVQAAFYRRKVLSFLLRFWFDNRLTIAASIATGKDKETGYFYLDAEFIKGETARLYNPFSIAHISEYHDLKDLFFPELQSHLMDAGFVGTLWQVGYGQPCSIPNFLCVRYDNDKTKEKWVWIDAESGVPALASHSLKKQLFFYLPQAVKLRRPLFDDLDADKLREYIKSNNRELKDKLGKSKYAELLENIDNLIDAHRDWKSMSRFSRVITHFQAKGRISKKYCLQLKSGEKSKIGFILKSYFPNQFSNAFSYCIRKIKSLLKSFNPLKWGVFFLRSILSKKYRIDKSCSFIAKKIDEWKEMGRISEKESKLLTKELYNQESSQYLADFGVFLALKPFGYFVKLLILPVLLLYGWVSPEAAILVIAFFSLSLRFLYAFFRGIEDLFSHRSFPYIALLIAPIPTFGTIAYPCQMVHSARKGHTVSQFIMYEVFSSVAKKIPIWGGYNSELEYFLNRMAFKWIKASE